MTHVAQVALAQELDEVRSLLLVVHALEQLVVGGLLVQAPVQLDRDAERNLGAILQHLGFVALAAQFKDQPCLILVLVGLALHLLDMLAKLDVSDEAKASQALGRRGVVTATGFGYVGIGLYRCDFIGNGGEIKLAHW